MFFFLNFYVAQVFSIPTIDIIGLCVDVAELSERWTVDLDVRPMQVRTPSEILCFYSPTNKIIFIRRESRWIKFLLFVVRSI